MVKKGKKRITITVDERTLKVLNRQRHLHVVLGADEYDVLLSYSEVIKRLADLVDN